MPALKDLPEGVILRALERLGQRERLRCRAACRAWAALPVTLPRRLRVRGESLESFCGFVSSCRLAPGGVEDAVFHCPVHIPFLKEALGALSASGARALRLDLGTSGLARAAEALRGASLDVCLDLGVYVEAYHESVDLTEIVEAATRAPPVAANATDRKPGLRSLKLMTSGWSEHYVTLSPTRELPGLVELRWCWRTRLAVDDDAWTKLTGLTRVCVGRSSTGVDLPRALSALPALETLSFAPEHAWSHVDLALVHPTVGEVKCPLDAFLLALERGTWRFPGARKVVLSPSSWFSRVTHVSREDFRAVFPAAETIEMEGVTRGFVDPPGSLSADARDARDADALERAFGVPVFGTRPTTM